MASDCLGTILTIYVCAVQGTVLFLSGVRKLRMYSTRVHLKFSNSQLENPDRRRLHLSSFEYCLLGILYISSVVIQGNGHSVVRIKTVGMRAHNWNGDRTKFSMHM